ncbi:hypothetical protein GCM10008965_32670 [Methylorubrum aminovorans]|nr:hypothetical protein GCM10025880_67620 [Methylorubrum aminovorans]GMA80395.1 hypothetical protein GCM10025880_68120 [Methylorubrum aminovorans]
MQALGGPQAAVLGRFGAFVALTPVRLPQRILEGAQAANTTTPRKPNLAARQGGLLSKLAAVGGFRFGWGSGWRVSARGGG